MRRSSNKLLVGLIAVSATFGPGPSMVRADDSQDKKGTVVAIDGLQSKAPANWKEEESSNQMRAYQFRVPAVKGDRNDAEMIIFFFGPGGGGTPADNVKRWKTMFVPPEGKAIDDVAKEDHFKVGDVSVVYLDVEGTYRFKARPFDPNAKVELRPHTRMLGVVFESKKGPYFFRLVGPSKTVTENKKGFDEWVKGFK